MGSSEPPQGRLGGLIRGAAGRGKSDLLNRLIECDLMAGRGIVVVDPPKPPPRTKGRSDQTDD